MSAETAVRVKIEPCEMDIDDTTGDCFQNTEDGELEDGELIDEDNRERVPESTDKLTQRARRFGLLNPPSRKVLDPEIEKLHRRMGVDSDTRTEAVHLYGTDMMKTQDVFAYFSGYSPASIEWITDKTCNVSWLDETACAKALKNCSIRIKGQGNEYDDDSDDDEEEECVKMEDIRCALPSGVWRKARPSALAPSLFIRYATQSDRRGAKPFPPTHVDTSFRGWSFLDEGDEVAKKVRTESSNPWVDIAKQWNYYENRSSQNAPPPRLVDARDVLTVRDTKKSYRPPDITKRKLERYPEKVVPVTNMISSRRMQADIEEGKLLERNKRVNHQMIGGVDLRERLARKRKFESDEEADSDLVEEAPPEEAPKVLSLRIEIDNTRSRSEDEWEDCNSTQSSDSDEVEVRSNVGDLRSKLRKLNPSPSSSSTETEREKKTSCVKSILRTKHLKHKSPSFSPLRIEIDNDNYCKSDEASD